jgi:hypothetical protein
MGLFLGMGPGAGMQQDIPLTLPAGLIATYIFGATGFGFGFDFRGWRPW